MAKIITKAQLDKLWERYPQADAIQIQELQEYGFSRAMEYYDSNGIDWVTEEGETHTVVVLMVLYQEGGIMPNEFRQQAIELFQESVECNFPDTATMRAEQAQAAALLAIEEQLAALVDLGNSEYLANLIRGGRY